MAKAAGRGHLAPHTDAQPEAAQVVTDKPNSQLYQQNKAVRPPTSYLGSLPAKPVTEPIGEALVQPPQGLPEWQAKQLVENGFDPAEFPTQDLATKVLTRLSSRPVQAPPQQFSPPAPSIPQQQEEFDPWKGVDRAALKSEFGEHGEKLMGVIDAIHSNYKNQLTQAQQGLATVHSHLSQSVAQQIDAGFSALEKRYPGAFGSGPVYQLDPNSQQYNQRMRVVPMAERLIQAGLAFSIDDALAQATERVLGPSGSYQKPAEYGERFSQTVGFSERSLPRGDKVPAKKAFLEAAQEIVNSVG